MVKKQKTKTASPYGKFAPFRSRLEKTMRRLNKAMRQEATAERKERREIAKARTAGSPNGSSSAWRRAIKAEEKKNSSQRQVRKETRILTGEISDMDQLIKRRDKIKREKVIAKKRADRLKRSKASNKPKTRTTRKKAKPKPKTRTTRKKAKPKPKTRKKPKTVRQSRLK